jgi:hypothetical protein
MKILILKTNLVLAIALVWAFILGNITPYDLLNFMRVQQMKMLLTLPSTNDKLSLSNNERE